MSDESTAISEAHVRKVQSDPSKRHGHGHLRKPETQAAPGLIGLRVVRLILLRLALPRYSSGCPGGTATVLV